MNNSKMTVKDLLLEIIKQKNNECTVKVCPFGNVLCTKKIIPVECYKKAIKLILTNNYQINEKVSNLKKSQNRLFYNISKKISN